MALRKALTKRLFQHISISAPPHAIVPPNTFHRHYLTSADKAFCRPFLQRYHSASTKFPEFLSLPVGDQLREKLRGLNFDNNKADHLRLDATADSLYGISAEDARKILRLSQVEKLKAKLREIPNTSISYSHYTRICVDACQNVDQGLHFAKMLDRSGNVIVLGNVVFLRPDQVAKSMESLISQSIAHPNDPRRKELEEMEKEKAIIDKKAKALVRGELYFGLGFLVVQTIGFMRLTFWELSWDVMEPICFFVTSFHFALAYLFFLKTSTEPTFQGYFYRRFKSKQHRLMKTHQFDAQRYHQLCNLFYPNYDAHAPNSPPFLPFIHSHQTHLRVMHH
ncbi:calcium uniporter protein 4, mitochondrial-like [Senna tora]|uniref:Calcium uniporter protein 4, mitochondrial-like n=1 Tax=Senna tora TaxID=362788 RepID=A0A834WRP0_9FABA|nr:calcium uniporter protein 4, mitochondrial-like [Senna tora]